MGCLLHIVSQFSLLFAGPQLYHYFDSMQPYDIWCTQEQISIHHRPWRNSERPSNSEWETFLPKNSSGVERGEGGRDKDTANLSFLIGSEYLNESCFVILGWALAGFQQLELCQRLLKCEPLINTLLWLTPFHVIWSGV